MQRLALALDDRDGDVALAESPDHDPNRRRGRGDVVTGQDGDHVGGYNEDDGVLDGAGGAAP